MWTLPGLEDDGNGGREAGREEGVGGGEGTVTAFSSDNQRVAEMLSLGPWGSIQKRS